MVIALNYKCIEVYNINLNNLPEKNTQEIQISPKKLSSFNVDEEVSALAFNGKYIVTGLSNGQILINYI